MSRYQPAQPITSGGGGGAHAPPGAVASARGKPLRAPYPPKQDGRVHSGGQRGEAHCC